MRKLITVFAVSFLTTVGAQAQDSLQNKPVKPVVKPVTAKTTPPKTYGAKAVQTPGGKPATTVARPVTTPTVGGQNPAPVTSQQQAPIYSAVQQNTDKSLSGQYRYILSKTFRYQQPMVAAFWKNVSDTLNAERKKLKAANEKLTEQSKSTAALQNDLNAKSQSLTEASTKQDEISLLGIGMPKATYNTVMWGLVGVMAVVLTIVILRTAGNRREAKYRTKLYDELSEEFQAYKVKANEKEKKLARELQTERNKVDELLGRG